MQPQRPGLAILYCECIVSNIRPWQDCTAGSLSMNLEYAQVRGVWKILLACAVFKAYRDFRLLQGRAAPGVPSTAPQEPVVSSRTLLFEGGTPCLLMASVMQAVGSSHANSAWR